MALMSVDGNLIAVEEIYEGTALTQAAAALDTVLHVDDTSLFDDAGGFAQVVDSSTIYKVEYSSVTDDGTLLLRELFPAGVEVGSPVYPLIAEQRISDRIASVDIGEGDPVQVALAHHQRAFWPQGEYHEEPILVQLSDDLQEIEGAPGRPLNQIALSGDGSPGGAIGSPGIIWDGVEGDLPPRIIANGGRRYIIISGGQLEPTPLSGLPYEARMSLISGEAGDPGSVTIRYFWPSAFVGSTLSLTEGAAKLYVDSQGDGVEVNGDGSGHAGPYSWDAAGNPTGPGGANVQAGVVNSGAFSAADTDKSVNVNFPTAFSVAPVVTATVVAASSVNINYACVVDSITTTGFTATVARNIGTGALDINWIATEPS